MKPEHKHRIVYWGGIDNTIIPMMATGAEREVELHEEILRLEDTIKAEKRGNHEAYLKAVKEKKKAEKELNDIQKKGLESAMKMSTLSSLQDGLEKSISKSVKGRTGNITVMTADYYKMGSAGQKFLETQMNLPGLQEDLVSGIAKATSLLDSDSEMLQDIGKEYSGLLESQATAIDLTQKLGQQYDDIGSDSFQDMSKEAETALKSAQRHKDFISKEAIPAIREQRLVQVGSYDLTAKKDLEELAKKRESEYAKINLTNMSAKAKRAALKKIDKDLMAQEDLIVKNADLTEDQTKEIQASADSEKDLTKQANKNLKTAEKNEATTARNKILHEQTAASVGFIAGPLEKAKSLLESMPMGGVISQFMGLNDIVGDFKEGITKSFKAAIDDQNNFNPGLAFENMNKQVTETFGKIGEGFDHMKKMGKGTMKPMIKSIKALNAATGGMLGPLVAVVAIIAIAGKLAKMFYGGISETRKEFGLTFASAATLQATLNATTMEFKMMGVSAEDVKAGAQGIMDNLGGIGQVTRANLQTFASLNATLGLSGESAGVLASQMMAVGAGSIEAVGSQLESVGALAAANGVAPAQVLEDVAGASEAFANFAKDGGENVFKAAISARKLGVSMETVAGTADALLDFESSINAQMEASMLTGRNINTDKARELALAGDLDGMQREITKQIGSSAEYEKLNVVQRKAMAAAFGVSVSELGKMVTNQDKLNNMTEGQVKRTDLIASLVQGLNTAWVTVMESLKPIIPLAIGILSPVLLIAAAFAGVIVIVGKVAALFNKLSVGGVGLFDVIMAITGAFIGYKLAMMAYNKVAMVQKAVDTMLTGVKNLKNIGTLREIATNKIALVGKKMGIVMSRNQYAWSWKTIGVNLKKIAIKVKKIALGKVERAGEIIGLGIEKAKNAAALVWTGISKLLMLGTIKKIALEKTKQAGELIGLGIEKAKKAAGLVWTGIQNLTNVGTMKSIVLDKVKRAGELISIGIASAKSAATTAFLVIQNLSIGSTIRETAAMVWKNTLMVFSTAATWAATAAQWALNVAMAANPIGLIILGVIALVAVIVLLFKKFNLFPKIIGGVMKVFNVFKNVVMNALKFAFAPLFLAWKAIKAVGSFIGGLFGGGDKSSEAASSGTSGGAPEMHSGGVVKETGNAVVEKGEVVSTPQQQQQQQSSSTISTQAMESKLDELIDLLGQSGPISIGVGGVKSNTKAISDQIV